MAGSSLKQKLPVGQEQEEVPAPPCHRRRILSNHRNSRIFDVRNGSCKPAISVLMISFTSTIHDVLKKELLHRREDPMRCFHPVSRGGVDEHFKIGKFLGW